MALEKGRATQYGPLIREFASGAHKREHILAINESSEIIDLFNLWESRIDKFPLLRDKLKATFGKGPLFQEDENVGASSNKARNDAFSFLVAGKFLASGVPVVAVEGIRACGADCNSNADLTVRWNNELIDFECKRPQTAEKLRTRTKEAGDQLRQPTRNGRQGVIAIDCSVLIRPENAVYQSADAEAAEAIFSTLLEEDILPKVNSFLTDSILGFLFFVRVPAMTRLPIVAPNNESIYRPDSITSWLFVGNSKNPAQCYLKDLHMNFRRSFHNLGDKE